MNEPIRILIVEDLPTDTELAQREIRKIFPACVFAQVETREDYLAALESFQPDLIISDYHMPHFDGMTALKLALERVPLTPLIIWTGSLNEDIAVDCMKAGASNYVIKERIKRLGTAVVHALEESRVRQERLRAEQALRKSEERFRSLYENATIGIYRTTPDGRILMANPAAVRLLGYDSLEEMAQRNLEESGFEPTYPRKEFRDRLERGGAISGLESAWIKKDGSTIFVRESARAICDENGKVLYYDGTFEDITERKRAEEALRESEEKFRTFTESAPVAIMIYQDYHCVYANPEAEQITEYTRQELDQVKFFDFAHPDYKDMVIEGGTAVERGESPPHKADFKIITKNGNEKWLDGRLEMIDYAGKRAALISATDITERKQAEEALRESEQRFRQLAEENARLLEQARHDAQAKSRLLQEINHRVKNNLTAIIGLLYAEQRHAQDQTSFDWQAAMHHLASQIEGLAQAHDMLSAAEWAPLPLDELTRRVILVAFKLLPSDKSVWVDVTPSSVQITPQQANSLALVINELTINTIRHALLERPMARIGVRIALDDETVVLEFRDDGPGYPEKVLHGEIHTLGLYLVQNIVKHDLRGHVTLHNDPGAVTTLRFRNAAAGEPERKLLHM